MDERAERIERFFQLPLIVAALLVIPVIAVEESAAPDRWKDLLGALNWASWGTFAAYVLAMLAVVPDRLRWLRAHPLDLVIVGLTAPFLPHPLQGARAIRMLQLLRLLRVLPSARRVFSLEGLRFAALLALIAWLVGGAAFADVEGRSTWDGVWWAANTLTTVGQSGIVPHTDGGRIVAIAVMLVGIGFFAFVTGAIAERFVATEVEEEVESPESDLVHELRSIRDRLERLEQRR